MLVVNHREDWDFALKRLVKNKANFSVTSRGSKQEIIIDGEVHCAYSSRGIIVSHANRKMVRPFVGAVQKGVNRYIERHGGMPALVQPPDHTRYFNTELFEKMRLARQPFWHVDIDRCYWTIMFHFGIISKKFFDKYRHFDDFKMLANSSIAMAARERFTDVYEHGQKVPEKRSVVEMPAHKRVFENVRNTAANSIASVYQMWPEDTIAHHTDCIYTTAKVRKACCDMLMDMGYSVKMSVCRFPTREQIANYVADSKVNMAAHRMHNIILRGADTLVIG